jgi:hypothetical protein
MDTMLRQRQKQRWNRELGRESPPRWLCKEGALSQRHRAPRRPLFERPAYEAPRDSLQASLREAFVRSLFVGFLLLEQRALFQRQQQKLGRESPPRWPGAAIEPQEILSKRNAYEAQRESEQRDSPQTQLLLFPMGLLTFRSKRGGNDSATTGERVGFGENLLVCSVPEQTQLLSLCLWLERISWGLVGRPLEERPTRGSMALQRALSKRGHRGGDSLPNCSLPVPANSKRPKGLVGRPRTTRGFSCWNRERAKLSPSMAGGGHRAPSFPFGNGRGVRAGFAGPTPQLRRRKREQEAETDSNAGGWSREQRNK